jgi:hypothetical protein
LLLSFLGLIIFSLLSGKQSGIKAASPSEVISDQASWNLGAKNANVDITSQAGDVILAATPGDTWTGKTNMLAARNSTAASAYGQYIFVAGGSNDTSSFLNSFDRYDTTNNSWVAKANIPYVVTGAGLATVGEKLYLIGGTNNSLGYGTILTTVEEYDPINDTWQAKTSMPTARYNFSVAVVNNKIYAIGGTETSVSFSVRVEEYDPSSDTWQAKTDMPTGRTSLCAASYQDSVYAFGGSVGMMQVTNLAQRFDVADNSWTSLTNMPTERAGLACAAIGNKIYAINGIGNPPLNLSPINEEFSIVGGTWATKINIGFEGSSLLSAVSVNGYIYAFGGGIDSGHSVSTNKMYPASYIYNSPGVHTSAATQITNANLYQWQTFTATYDKPSNTNVSFRFRTSTDAASWTSWTASQTPASTVPLDISALVTSSTGPPGGETFYKYLQVETTLTSTDGVSTPTLNDYSIGYHTNVAPSKPTAVTATMVP